jgi:hypothetical protein
VLLTRKSCAQPEQRMAEFRAFSFRAGPPQAGVELAMTGKRVSGANF